MAILGIDLGTSNSLIGIWDGERATLLKNEFGSVLTPSVVGVDDSGEMVVGEIAKQRLMTHPMQTVATFKRFMGTEKRYTLGKQAFSPVELSYFVLRKLRELAIKETNEACTEATISVPAYFNAVQREATIEAAHLAGIEVVHLVSEPTAAAIAYGANHSTEDEHILVVDLGGGTFDVSMLDVFEGILQVEAISGDNFLGGEDFTDVIVKDFLSKNGLVDSLMKAEETSILWGQCERIKCSLMEMEEVTVNFSLMGQSYEYTLTQKEYEELCEGLLQRMKNPMVRVFHDSSMELRDISKVILIGGATRASVVRKYISRLLGQFPYSDINPDEAVALGAVIFSALRESKEMLEEMILTDVCGYTLGVDIVHETEEGIKRGYFNPIIERNTTIPVSKVETFSSVYDNQKTVKFSIYQGENRMVADNIKLGEISIPIPRAPKGLLVDVRFTYNEDGILEVIVTVPQTMRTERLIIEKAPGALSKAEIEARLKKLEHIKVRPLERAETRLLIARAERLYAESLGQKREYVQAITADFEEQLRKQDEAVTLKASVEFTKKLNALEGEMEDF